MKHIDDLPRLVDQDPVRAYALVFGDRWAADLAALIPARMQPGIVRTILLGTPPGSFLEAIFRNDFIAAAGAADFENRRLLWNYAAFLHNAAPPGCFRDFDGWLAMGGVHGREAAA